MWALRVTIGLTSSIGWLQLFPAKSPGPWGFLITKAIRLWGLA